MHKPIAALTLAAYATLYSPAAAASELPPASPATAELLHESNFTQAGFNIQLAFTRDASGQVLGEATVLDPTTGDEVDVWSDGVTLSWSGVVAGGSISGSIPVLEVDANLSEVGPVCFIPAVAIVCLGAVAILFSGSGCAHFINCLPTGSETPDPCANGACQPPVPDEGGGGDSSEEDGDDAGDSED